MLLLGKFFVEVLKYILMNQNLTIPLYIHLKKEHNSFTSEIILYYLQSCDSWLPIDLMTWQYPSGSRTVSNRPIPVDCHCSELACLEGHIILSSKQIVLGWNYLVELENHIRSSYDEVAIRPWSLKRPWPLIINILISHLKYIRNWRWDWTLLWNNKVLPMG